jgi:hypothetical protein
MSMGMVTCLRFTGAFASAIFGLLVFRRVTGWLAWLRMKDKNNEFVFFRVGGRHG